MEEEEELGRSARRLGRLAQQRAPMAGADKWRAAASAFEARSTESGRVGVPDHERVADDRGKKAVWRVRRRWMVVSGEGGEGPGALLLCPARRSVDLVLRRSSVKPGVLQVSRIAVSTLSTSLRESSRLTRVRNWRGP